MDNKQGIELTRYSSTSRTCYNHGDRARQFVENNRDVINSGSMFKKPSLRLILCRASRQKCTFSIHLFFACLIRFLFSCPLRAAMSLLMVAFGFHFRTSNLPRARSETRHQLNMDESVAPRTSPHDSPERRDYRATASVGRRDRRYWPFSSNESDIQVNDRKLISIFYHHFDSAKPPHSSASALNKWNIESILCTVPTTFRTAVWWMPSRRVTYVVKYGTRLLGYQNTKRAQPNTTGLFLAFSLPV